MKIEFDLGCQMFEVFSRCWRNCFATISDKLQRLPQRLFGTMLPSLVFIILALAALIVDTVGILMTRPSPGASQPGKARAA